MITSRLSGCDASALAILVAIFKYFEVEVRKPTGIFSLSHGVDFGHLQFPLDVNSRCPLHWSYRLDLLNRAEQYKPSFLLPHPFVLYNEILSKCASQSTSSGRIETLIVGPPPGMVNNIEVLRALQREGIHEGTVLIKPRGVLDNDYKFWISRGFEVACGPQGEGFGWIEGLSEILNQSERIIATSLSSVVIFGGYLGREVTLIPDCITWGWEDNDFFDQLGLSKLARDLVASLLVYSDQRQFINLCKFCLGSDLLEQLDKLIRESALMFEGVDCFSMYDPKRAKNVTNFNTMIGRLSGFNALSDSIFAVVTKHLKKKLFGRDKSDLVVVGIDDLHYRLHGLTSENHIETDACMYTKNVDAGMGM